MKSSTKGTGVTLKRVSKSVVDKQDADFYSKLNNFPHSFLMTDQNLLQSTTIQRLERGLQSALKAGYNTPLERARARNLLAFALFRQNKAPQALQELENALQEEGQGQNIVSLANKAFILWKTGNRVAATSQVDFLENLRDDAENFQYLEIKAKAELAFSYTRLGHNYYPYAVAVFEEVISKAKEPEKWLWTFGLGLTLRRASHLQMAPEFGPDACNTDRNLHILHLFQKVINNASKQLQAKAYAELGVHLNNNRCNGEVLEAAGMDAVEACERALRLDDKDNSVLVKCSKIFRYRKLNLERCCSLLKSAIEIRPSSTAYHHLGLTYKAMATDLKYSAYGARRRNRNSYERNRSVNAKYTDFWRNSHQTLQASSQYYIEMLRRLVKSPTKETRFSRDDKYVPEIIKYFELAKSFSDGENKRAAYDLALLYKALGEYEKALEVFKELTCSKDTLDLTRLNALEQSGLIYLAMIKTEINVKKKKYLKKEGDSMLNMALVMALRHFSKIPQFQDNIQEIWQAFSALFNALEDNCDLMPEDVLMEKARLLQAFRKPKESKEFLQELLKISPAEKQNPKFIQLRVQCYITENDYENAATCISCQTDEIRNQVKELSGDEQYLQKIYFEAGKQVLVQNSGKASLAQDYFRFAFDETFKKSIAPASVNKCAHDLECDSENEVQLLQVIFIHDQQTESEMINARKVACLVRHVCGLRTSWSVEEWTPGCDVDDEIKQIQESRLVVVIIGSEGMSPEFRMSVNNAVQTRPTKALLLDGSRVPEVLRESPVLQCPQVILDMNVDDYGMHTQDRVDAVCSVFSFLIGINTD